MMRHHHGIVESVLPRKTETSSKLYCFMSSMTSYTYKHFGEIENIKVIVEIWGLTPQGKKH